MHWAEDLGAQDSIGDHIGTSRLGARGPLGPLGRRARPMASPVLFVPSSPPCPSAFLRRAEASSRRRLRRRWRLMAAAAATARLVRVSGDSRAWEG